VIHRQTGSGGDRSTVCHKTDDHIDYFVIRIDPDKITPLKTKTQSKEYRSEPADDGK